MTQLCAKLFTVIIRLNQFLMEFVWQVALEPKVKKTIENKTKRFGSFNFIGYGALGNNNYFNMANQNWLNVHLLFKCKDGSQCYGSTSKVYLNFKKMIYFKLKFYIKNSKKKFVSKEIVWLTHVIRTHVKITVRKNKKYYRTIFQSFSNI